MKRHSIHLWCGTAALAALSVPSAAMAAGVDAGTLIVNTATATYQSGADTRSVDSNTVTVRVDEVLNVAVASNDAVAVDLGNNKTALSFTITNLGNGPEAFALSADAHRTGNPFDATVLGIAFDTNGNGTFDDGIDGFATGDTRSTASIAADQTARVFVIVNAPAGTVDNQLSTLRLTATAATGSGTPGKAFAGQGFGGGDAVVGATKATAYADGQLKAHVATVSLVKTVTIVDPFGGSQPVPGAIATFSIVASTVGSGSVVALTIADPIPTGTTYRAGSLRLDAATLTDAADADAGRVSASGISVAVGSLATGVSRTVKFSVTIN